MTDAAISSPASANALVATTPTAIIPVTAWSSSFRRFMTQPAVQRAMPMMALVIVAGLVALAWSLVSAPDQRAISDGASESDRAAMAEALQQSGIAYAVDQDSGALTVGDDDYHQARMMLAAQGLPKGTATADEAIGSISMGSSRAVEAERLRLAREQDLARTIEAIEVVRSARVHVAESTRSAFVRASEGPAASVMVSLFPGRALSDAQVRGIVHLVASSQPNLSPDRVSLIDQNGNLLSGGGDGSAGNVSQAQIAAQTQVQGQYRQSIMALLTPILGEGNFTAEVHVDLDFAEVQATREGYPAEPRALRSEQGQMSTEAGVAAEGGVPGGLSNTPPPASTLSETPPANATASALGALGESRRTENYARNFAVTREVSVTRQQSPVVRRVTVAIAVRNVPGARGRSAQELGALDRLVKGAVGYDEARGDAVAIDARAFVAPTVVEESWMDSPWIKFAGRNLAAVIVCALLIFGLGRPLLKRAMSPPTIAPNAAGFEVAHGERPGEERPSLSSISLDLIEANRDFETRAGLIRGFVRQDPARAALVVRDLISSEERGA